MLLPGITGLTFRCLQVKRRNAKLEADYITVRFPAELPLPFRCLCVCQ